MIDGSKGCRELVEVMVFLIQLIPIWSFRIKETFGKHCELEFLDSHCLVLVFIFSFLKTTLVIWKYIEKILVYVNLR